MIKNQLASCYDGHGKPMQWSDIQFLVVHRTDLAQLGPDNPNPIPDEQLNGPELCQRFHDAPLQAPRGLGTGGRPPYHFLVCHDGHVEQCLPLYVRGAHAVGYNWRSIAVAVVGRCDRTELRPGQWSALVDLCLKLAPINGGLDIVGHTALPGGSGDPNKRCPGKFCDPYIVEMDVARKLPVGWRDLNRQDVEMRLIGAGITIY
jgi:hypothetical protein